MTRAPTVRPVWNGAASLKKLLVPIGLLAPHPDNPRQHDLPTIRQSLEALGQQKPIVVVPAGRVHTEFQTIVAGHGTTLAARELGWTHIAAVESDLADDDIARFVLADNRSSDRGGYDDERLAKLLGSLSDNGGLVGTGYDRSDLTQLLSALKLRNKHLGDPDAVVEPPEKPKSKLGEVYDLGGHLLMCGDATDPEQVRTLFAESGLDLVDVVWTDPPYGVEYVGKTAAALTIRNDNAEGLQALLVDAFHAVGPALAHHARFYIAGPSGPRALDFHLAIQAVGWTLHQVLVWRKQRMILGHSDYHYAHELLFYGWVPKADVNGKGRPGRGRHHGTRWYGGNDQTSVFEYDSPARSESHPTMKPVGLIEHCLANSSQSGTVVYDPFGGSGSTLIACERLGRRARLMEIDPVYCDVIRQRYADFTDQPELAP